MDEARLAELRDQLGHHECNHMTHPDLQRVVFQVLNAILVGYDNREFYSLPRTAPCFGEESEPPHDA
jgi:hypothetical protein